MLGRWSVSCVVEILEVTDAGGVAVADGVGVAVVPGDCVGVAVAVAVEVRVGVGVVGQERHTE